MILAVLDRRFALNIGNRRRIVLPEAVVESLTICMLPEVVANYLPTNEW